MTLAASLEWIVVIMPPPPSLPDSMVIADLLAEFGYETAFGEIRAGRREPKLPLLA